MKKSVIVALLLVPVFAFVSCASTEKAAAKTETKKEAPAESAARKAAMAENGAIDLATYETAGVAVKYDANAYTLNVKDTECFQFRLPTPLDKDQSITVHIKGTNNGATGFRSWLVDDVQTTASNLYLDAKAEGLKPGAFDLTYVLTATQPITYLFFKGPQYGTNIDDITWSFITVAYNQ